MLEALRAATQGVVAKLLLFLLVISFAIWGASGAFVGGIGNSTVQFGGTSVTMQDYRLAYDMQSNAISRQMGTRLTRDQARAFGVDQAVLSQIIAGAVMDENANNLGLGITSDRLAQMIASDDNFHDSTGRFSRGALQQALSQIGMREEDYVRNRQAVAVRRQFLDAVAADVTTPKAFDDIFAAYQAQKRVFDYVEVTPGAITEVPVPSEADIQAFYDDNKGEYVAPEYRQITIVRLTAADISRPDLIDDEAVATEYENTKSKYTTPEKRHVEQMVFKDKAEAQAALDRIRGGETFDAIVTESGRAPADVDLGTVAKSEIPDVTVADAAFGLQLNEVSDIVEGIFGPVLLRVTEIQPESVKPMADVADEIRAQLALAKATDDLFDVHDKLEDERAAGEGLASAAKNVGLTTRTIEAVDAQGNAPDGTKVADIPEGDQLVAAAFQTDPEVETDPIQIGSSGFVWYQVDSVTPERQKPLDEVADAVKQAWTADAIAKKVAELADSIRDRVAKGEDFSTVVNEVLPANADGSPAVVQVSAELNRSDSSDELPKAAVAAGFAVPEGAVDVAPANNVPSKIVLRVAKVAEGDVEPVPASVNESVARSIADGIINALAADFQSRGELQINQQAIEMALGS